MLEHWHAGRHHMARTLTELAKTGAKSTQGSFRVFDFSHTHATAEETA